MVIILDQACKVGRAGRYMKQTCNKTYEAQDCEVCYAAHQLSPTHNKICPKTLLQVICFIHVLSAWGQAQTKEHVQFL